ncbi:unnamed protein product [Phaeothamnion confervicola]
MTRASCDTPNYGNYSCVYIVTHLHGGATPVVYDGMPEDGIGPGENVTYTYFNGQESGTLWRHDHLSGVTRLNVYSGLAQFYLLRDDNEEERMTAAGAACALGQVRRDGTGVVDNSNGCELEMAIQDRDFTAAGDLFYQQGSAWQAEAFAPYVTVNGVVWPHLTVQPTFYRLRLLNGCDSRFLALQVVARCVGMADRVVPIYQVGTDVGFANAVSSFPASAASMPRQNVLRDYLLMAPGSRSDSFVSFTEFFSPNNTCVFDLINRAGYPFKLTTPFGGTPVSATPNPASDGVVMRFRFPKPTFTGAKHPLPAVIASGSTYFREKIGPYKEPVPSKIRKVILSKTWGEDGQTMVLLGAVVDDRPVPGIPWCSAEYNITETPILGATEEWWIYNLTPDTHPIHLHLVDFQILGRCPLAFGADGEVDYATNIKTACEGPRPEENGPKDIVHASEGYVTKIRATFDIPGLSVWHCHILRYDDDNEMMRPMCIQKDKGTGGADCADYWKQCKQDDPGFPSPPAV